MKVTRMTTASGDDVVGIIEGPWLREVPHAGSVLDLLSAAPVGDDSPSSGDHRMDELTAQVLFDGVVSLRDCVGFLDHIRNCRRARGVDDELPTAWSERPAFYFANSRSLHSSDQAVSVPPLCEEFDFEFEIGAVLVKGGSNLTPAEAADCIGGYVLYCDWSARDIQADERTMQIGQGKAKDAAISLGPWVLTKDEADQYRTSTGFDFDVTVHVNGDEVLSTRFDGMDWTFEELVAYASLGASVSAGDVIASGTVPGGCLLESSGSADFRGWLQPGDTVRLDGGPLGALSAMIDAPVAPPAWRHTPTAGVVAS